ncbi:hypothetical protein FHX71_001596 [Promicromonospora sukumoe]|uniref:Uncharacterized protein n=1 Tax=Promicromonospora sukumoe TaxID=88382 RepID=A0A7W3J7N5_9MICO|nr:hypothetical protein [Promicromonospora sukumoe]
MGTHHPRPSSPKLTPLLLLPGRCAADGMTIRPKP